MWTIFSHSHAIAALIWAAALGSVVLCVMLLVQRILFLKEFMEVSPPPPLPSPPSLPPSPSPSCTYPSPSLSPRRGLRE